MPALDSPHLDAGTWPAPAAQAAVWLAAQALARGELVAFPTETVYGLGARADDDSAVAAIFQAKGRPSDHPLIVHLPTPPEGWAQLSPDAWQEALGGFAAQLPPMARVLMPAFWPGPLTLIVPRLEGRGRAAAGGQASVGLRCPAHPVAQGLLGAARTLGVAGVAAPSANRFGRLSPTTAEHVLAEFHDLEPGLRQRLTVLDGGACEVGIESSIVDCTGEVPVLLRPGMVQREALNAVLGRELGLALGQRQGPSPRASGTLAAHYAPRAPLRLMSAPQLRQALAVWGEAPLSLAVYSRERPAQAPAGLVFRAMPAQAAAVAHELFAVLRSFDEAGVRLIWVETPDATPAWEGVLDRLQRAAAAA